MKRGLLQDELSRFQRSLLTDSLRFMKFDQGNITKNKSLIGRIGVLQKRVTKEQAVRKVVEEKLVTLKCFVLASVDSAPKLAESDKLLEAVRVEVTILKVQAVRADIEKAESEHVFEEVCKESEQGKLCLNVTLVGRNRAERSTCSLSTESLDAVNAFVR